MEIVNPKRIAGYKLAQIYMAPHKTINPGVFKTSYDWLRMFPALEREDLDIKSDWFEPVYVEGGVVTRRLFNPYNGLFEVYFENDVCISGKYEIQIIKDRFKAVTVIYAAATSANKEGLDHYLYNIAEEEIKDYIADKIIEKSANEFDRSLVKIENNFKI